MYRFTTVAAPKRFTNHEKSAPHTDKRERCGNTESPKHRGGCVLVRELKKSNGSHHKCYSDLDKCLRGIDHYLYCNPPVLVRTLAHLLDLTFHLSDIRCPFRVSSKS